MFSLGKRSAALSNPKVGLLNLRAENAAELVRLDSAFLARLFEAIEVQDSAVPQCDVLFLYADIAPGGGVTGSVQGLREIIRDSGAKVVVVASANPPDRYIKAGAERPYGRANLVMTLNRRGNSFEHFFTELFSKMKTGVSMPDAWVQLDPQVPVCVADSNPETIFACELGALSFA